MINLKKKNYLDSLWEHATKKVKKFETNLISTPTRFKNELSLAKFDSLILLRSLLYLSLVTYKQENH